MTEAGWTLIKEEAAREHKKILTFEQQNDNLPAPGNDKK